MMQVATRLIRVYPPNALTLGFVLLRFTLLLLHIGNTNLSFCTSVHRYTGDGGSSRQDMYNRMGE